MQGKARACARRGTRAFAHPTGGSVGCAKHPDRRGACHRAALRADPLAPSGHRLRVRTASIALRRSAAASVARMSGAISGVFLSVNPACRWRSCGLPPTAAQCILPATSANDGHAGESARVRTARYPRLCTPYRRERRVRKAPGSALRAVRAQAPRAHRQHRIAPQRRGAAVSVYRAMVRDARLSPRSSP